MRPWWASMSARLLSSLARPCQWVWRSVPHCETGTAAHACRAWLWAPWAWLPWAAGLVGPLGWGLRSLFLDFVLVTGCCSGCCCCCNLPCSSLLDLGAFQHLGRGLPLALAQQGGIHRACRTSDTTCDLLRHSCVGHLKYSSPWKYLRQAVLCCDTFGREKHTPTLVVIPNRD